MSSTDEEYQLEVITEAEQRLATLKEGAANKVTPTREELAKLLFRLGRSIRLYVKPDRSDERYKFWDETRGILKRIIRWEKFSPVTFDIKLLQEAVMEDLVQETLDFYIKWIIGRRENMPPEAPWSKRAEAKRKAEEEAKQEEEANKKGKGKGGKLKSKPKGGKKKREDMSEEDKQQMEAYQGALRENQDTWDASKDWVDEADDKVEAELRGRWDEEDSDPDEPCPDKKQFGNCSYGRQCGFCYR